MGFDERTSGNKEKSLERGGSSPKLASTLALSDKPYADKKKSDEIKICDEIKNLTLDKITVIAEEKANFAVCEYEVWINIYNDLIKGNVDEKGLTLDYINKVINKMVEGKKLKEAEITNIKTLAKIMVNNKFAICNRAKSLWHLSGGNLHKFGDWQIENEAKHADYLSTYYNLLDNARNTLFTLSRNPNWFVQPFWMEDLVQYNGVWNNVLTMHEAHDFRAGKESVITIYDPLKLSDEQRKNAYSIYSDYEYRKDIAKDFSELGIGQFEPSKEKDPLKASMYKLFEDEDIFKEVSGAELAFQNPVFHTGSRWV